MRFDSEKYLKRYNPEENDPRNYISSEDFSKDQEFVELVSKEGKLNDVTYSFSTGIKQSGKLKVKLGV